MADDKRVVILTGATRGIGRAMVDELARAGHTVLGCGRSASHIADLTAAHAAPHDFAVLDVTDAAGVQSWADRLIAAHGPPDLVLNNAALINRNAPLWEVPADEFSDVIDVNIKGVANVIRAFAPAMIARQRGVFVNFSSGWGRSTSPDVAPYCATKFAIEGLSQALAQELPRGMVSVALNPGTIDTDMLRSCFSSGASSSPSPDAWARTAVPYILGISVLDNGKPLSMR